VEELYYHSRLKRSEQELSLQESDLFNTEQWYLWGLGEKSLLLAAASAGAVVGASTGIALDAASAGLLGSPYAGLMVAATKTHVAATVPSTRALVQSMG
jgi:hypothetical protein